MNNLVKWSGIEEMWYGKVYARMGRCFSVSVRWIVKLNGIGFNTLDTSFGKMYPGKENKSNQRKDNKKAKVIR